MTYQKPIRIPRDRIGSLLGREGADKRRIEEACSVSLSVDSESGVVTVTGDPAGESSEPFKAAEMVMAIGRGFSPESAMRLLDGASLHVIDLREFAGKSPSQIERIKGRIIGERGRARRNVEELSGTRISVYGRTVSVIGGAGGLRVAVGAIRSLSGGSMHASVYRRLEAVRRREREARMQLWEPRDV